LSGSGWPAARGWGCAGCCGATRSMPVGTTQFQSPLVVQTVPKHRLT